MGETKAPRMERRRGFSLEALPQGHCSHQHSLNGRECETPHKFAESNTVFGYWPSGDQGEYHRRCCSVIRTVLFNRAADLSGEGAHEFEAGSGRIGIFNPTPVV